MGLPVLRAVRPGGDELRADWRRAAGVHLPDCAGGLRQSPGEVTRRASGSRDVDCRAGRHRRTACIVSVQHADGRGHRLHVRRGAVIVGTIAKLRNGPRPPLDPVVKQS